MRTAQEKERKYDVQTLQRAYFYFFNPELRITRKREANFTHVKSVLCNFLQSLDISLDRIFQPERDNHHMRGRRTDSDEQSKILRMLNAGATIAEIARRTRISPHTVAKYRDKYINLIQNRKDKNTEERSQSREDERNVKASDDEAMITPETPQSNTYKLFERMKQMEIKNIIMNRIANRGKPTIQGILSLEMLRGLRGNKGGNGDDVEKAVKNAVEPLNQKIMDLERERERERDRQEQDRRYRYYDRSLDEIKILISGNQESKGNNEILKRLNELQAQVQSKHEENKNQKEEEFEGKFIQRLDDIEKEQNQPIEDKYDALMELEENKRKVLSALGIRRDKKPEDTADKIMGEIPKTIKTFSTIKDLFQSD